MRSRSRTAKGPLLGAVASLALGGVGPWAAWAADGGATRQAPGAPPEAATGWPTGKIEPALASALSQRAAGPVRLVYVLEDVAPPRGRLQAGTAGGSARQLAETRSSFAAQHEGASRRLRETGHTVVYASPYAGVIVATGGAAAVAAAVADPRVRAVYLERTNAPRLNAAKVVTQAAVVTSRGLRGQGVRVGVVEAGRIGTHPNLPANRRTLCRPDVRTGVDFHKTEVAGVIQSTSSTYTGAAPQVTIIDGNAANFSDAEMIATTDCVISEGATAINMSFGTDTDGDFTAFAEYVDRVVYNTGVVVVVAVSNECSLRMGSPEVAFNDISVGAFSDRNTVPLEDDRHTCDPVFAPPFGAFLDPPSSNRDREQPDVVAPGELIRTTAPGGSFTQASGTSFAAPNVAGGVALLQARAGASSPALEAERVRAIVMASARHNVEGGAGLSDRDGAGAVRFAAADATLANAESWWFRRRGGAVGFPIAQPFAASAGQRVRVALAWAHKPNSGNRTVSTDLNLAVANPRGADVASSSSFDNNFEVVEFTAAASGTYAVRVENARPSDGAEFVGLAVSRTDR